MIMAIYRTEYRGDLAIQLPNPCCVGNEMPDSLLGVLHSMPESPQACSWDEWHPVTDRRLFCFGIQLAVPPKNSVLLAGQKLTFACLLPATLASWGNEYAAKPFLKPGQGIELCSRGLQICRDFPMCSS